MQVTRLITLVLLFALTLSANQITLKTGWNLIGIDSTDQVNILKNNQSIIRAAGGGVGGGGDFNYNRDFSQYATGSMKLGQGYWIKVDTDTTLTYTKSTAQIATVDLKTGWNLINTCVQIDASNVLKKYPAVIRAAGGGVGGGGDFNYNRQYAQYATGVTKAGQGYWFKVDKNMSIQCTSPYTFRALGSGGDTINSKLTVFLNGVQYTLVPYSTLNLNNYSTAAEITTFNGTLNSKKLKNIFAISADYKTKYVVIKVFKNATNFTKANLVATSRPIQANGNFLTYNITIDNPHDFRPIAPTDTNIAMPPVAPEF